VQSTLPKTLRLQAQIPWSMTPWFRWIPSPPMSRSGLGPVSDKAVRPFVTHPAQPPQSPKRKEKKSIENVNDLNHVCQIKI